MDIKQQITEILKGATITSDRELDTESKTLRILKLIEDNYVRKEPKCKHYGKASIKIINAEDIKKTLFGSNS